MDQAHFKDAIETCLNSDIVTHNHLAERKFLIDGKILYQIEGDTVNIISNCFLNVIRE